MIQTTTTRRGPKAFSFSYSKIKNFETCPKRYDEIDIRKSVKEPESEELAYGNTLHKSFAERLSKGTELPLSFKHFEPWMTRIIGDGSGKILVEQQLAIQKDLEPCEWFAPTAWYRGIADVIKIVGTVALAIDWKTGKIKEDGVQLGLMAQCIFSHHPQVQRIRTEFIWLKEDATTRADFSRADMVGLWNGVLPRVALLQRAAETNSYPPKPGGLCRKYCPVTGCEHHGK